MEQFEKDLRFVRSAVEKQQARTLAPAIPLLWAAICAIGFTLQDFAPQAVEAFWTWAVPGGMLLSGLFGYLHGKNRPSSGARDAVELLHWISIPAAIGLLIYIVSMPAPPERMGAQMSLLLVAVVYYLAGLHLNRAWLFGGLAMAAGVLLIPLVPTYAFTVTGLLIALALVVGTFAPRFTAAGPQHDA